MNRLIAVKLRPWKKVCILSGIFLVFCALLFLQKQVGARLLHGLPVETSTKRNPTLDSLYLTRAECEATFPDLTRDIGKMVALGPFPLKQARDMGPLQVRIRHGKLYVLHKESEDIMSQGLLDARMATLHQLHRAVITSSEPLPDTIVSINVNDGPVNDTWSYSRPAVTAHLPGTPAITRAFLMPHFSFWSWPLPFVGSMTRAAAAIDAIEASMSFLQKDPRPVWRGTKRYNSIQNPHLRLSLLAIAEGVSWADVQELAWDGGNSEGWKDNKTNSSSIRESAQRPPPHATNALMIEDFCRYKYILHTEGITYSGRLQLLQMCHSVLLTPPMAWLQHTTHLVRPLFSLDLPLEQKWTLSETDSRAWAEHYTPETANMVFVAPDWSDLKETIDWLEGHPVVAEGIAQRQRELFVLNDGYLSPAAETCYWRALIRGWDEVVQTEGQGWESQRGVGWELFSMGYENDALG